MQVPTDSHHDQHTVQLTTAAAAAAAAAAISSDCRDNS